MAIDDEAAGDRRLLVALLRLGAFVTGSGFFAVLLPVDWMATAHRWLGLGELPRVAIVDYLTRSNAALYGCHGVLLWIVSRDPVRYHGIVRYIGWMNIGFGLTILGIDLHAGLPAFWTIAEGPGVVVLGAAVLYLSRARR
jgi:hypothetical protein